MYLSNQSYYLDRCVQPFLRILFSLGTPAKTLLKKCEMIHLRRLSGSLPVDSVWRNVLAISAMSSTRIPTKCESPWSPCRMNSLPIRRLCLNCVTINTSSRINSGHATGSILRHHTARFSARWQRVYKKQKRRYTALRASRNASYSHARYIGLTGENTDVSVQLWKRWVENYKPIVLRSDQAFRFVNESCIQKSRPVSPRVCFLYLR